MNFINKYPENCDFLRKRFNLNDNVSLYKIIDIVVEYIKSNNLNVKEESTNVEDSQKEKKRGRPKKSDSRNNG